MSRPNRKARREQFQAELAAFPKNSVERTLRRQIEAMQRTNAYLLEKQAEMVRLPAILFRLLDIAGEALRYIASNGDINSAATAHLALDEIDKT